LLLATPLFLSFDLFNNSGNAGLQTSELENQIFFSCQPQSLILDKFSSHVCIRAYTRYKCCFMACLVRDNDFKYNFFLPRNATSTSRYLDRGTVLLLRYYFHGLTAFLENVFFSGINLSKGPDNYASFWSTTEFSP